MSAVRTILRQMAAQLTPGGASQESLPLPPADPGRIAGLWCIMRYLSAADVPGDLVECGVGYGHSFYFMGRWADLLGMHERTLWGFDSFAGFPEPTLEDVSPRATRAGEWGDANSAHVRRHFEVNSLGDYWRRCARLVPGFFEDTLPGAGLGKVAFLHADCDLYRSYATVLDELGDRLDRRGIILYDEYASPRWPGATAAVDERLPALGHVLFFSPLMNRYFSCSSEMGEQPDEWFALLLDELRAVRAVPGAVQPL